MFNADLSPEAISSLLDAALKKRTDLLTDSDTDCCRIFNGFYEGCSAFSIDRYAETAVILWQEKKTPPSRDLLEVLTAFCSGIPEITSVLYKNRYDPDPQARLGRLLAGTDIAVKCREWGHTYPLRLTMNKDCGFYLDSALLRKWLLLNSAGKRVLNTFAYTGSLGLAADYGGAAKVTQTDMNRNYLQHIPGEEIIIGDFYRVMGDLRHSERLFDVVILDPPFFSVTGAGRVDQTRNCIALANKIRPLVADGGQIIIINNALFLPGADFAGQISSICGEYLKQREIIPVPDSFFGGDPDSARLPVPCAPFNHPTKMIIIDVSRKDHRK